MSKSFKKRELYDLALDKTRPFGFAQGGLGARATRRSWRSKSGALPFHPTNNNLFAGTPVIGRERDAEGFWRADKVRPYGPVYIR